MLRSLCRGALWAVFAASVPVVALTPAIAGKRDRCCCRCNRPQCVCPVPVLPQAAVQPVTYQPVYETQFVQQPVLQQRDVVATEYRYEPVTETIPTTIVENVTVDEGSYQTVWVPRVTTRPVARTVYQSRTAYRSVPYQVTRRVTEYAWQSQPQQTVRYEPVPAGLPSYALAPTGTYGGIAYGATWPVTVAQSPVLPAYPGRVVASAPVVGAPIVANPPAYVTAPSLATSTLAPASPIVPRAPVIADSSPNHTEPLFVPAPSAAQVWRTPRGTLTR